MSQQVQWNIKNPLTSLHHSGLIKILICSKLDKRHDNWVKFLKRNQFENLVSTPKSIRQAPPALIDEVARTKAPKPSSPGNTEEAPQFIIKYRRKEKKGLATSISTIKSRGKKQRIEESNSPSIEQVTQQTSMAKIIPRWYTRSMSRQKEPPTKVNKTEISPINVEEDSPARPPNSLRPSSPPPENPLDHRTNSGEACIDSFLAQFEDVQQPTVSDDYLYEK